MPQGSLLVVHSSQWHVMLFIPTVNLQEPCAEGTSAQYGVHHVCDIQAA